MSGASRLANGEVAQSDVRGKELKKALASEFKDEANEGSKEDIGENKG